MEPRLNQHYLCTDVLHNLSLVVRTLVFHLELYEDGVDWMVFRTNAVWQSSSDPFDLRYGKYCGIGYTGCSGAVPCDGLDRCCMVHDRCIGSQLTNYLNKTCNSNLRSCIEAFKNSGNATFAGANCSASDVETVAITAMDIATGSTGFSPPMPFSFGWVTLSVCGLSVLLLLWPSLMVNQFRS
jgi:hypothetical protein